MANILVLGVKVPFVKGGQEVLVSTLVQELRARSHEVDVVELPFQCPPKENLLKYAALWRSLDFSNFAGKKVDIVIATKFPSYYAKHAVKSLWLVHQHRFIYELYGGSFSDFSDDPRDEALRQMLMQGDKQVIGECRYISGISKNVVERLKHFNDIQGEALYPPLPMGSRYFCEPSENYILSVGRLARIKRADLMIKALPFVYDFVKLKIVGAPDEPGIMEYYQNEVKAHGLMGRVEFLGRVSDEELLKLYSKALAVYYAPHNEDYGYVTLEAFASGKPVITATDSGGVLEFVSDGQNGLVVEPDREPLGKAINRLVEENDLAERLGSAGRELISRLGIKEGGWDSVINKLLSPLGSSKCA